MPARLIIIPGEKYNRLTIVKEVDPEIQYNKGKITPLRKFECLCDCGKTTVQRFSGIKGGSIKSCGCLKNENLGYYKHGGSKEVLYRVWVNMIQRTEDQTVRAYKNYGGRGISMCAQWRGDYEVFRGWAMENGWEQGLEVDRRDNNGNYGPENCRIVTRKINCNNTRRTRIHEYNGEMLSITQIDELLGIPPKKIMQRIDKQGWSFEKAISIK